MSTHRIIQMMKVMVLTSKLVKPCRLTPPHLRSYKISVLDEINPPLNHARLLFFSSNACGMEEKLASLEQSLPQILSHFYPLAGRYNAKERRVDCDDQGAHFSTAEADHVLSEVVGVAEPEQLNRLLPVDFDVADESADPILAVQVNRFRCGGLAIAVCAWHRVVDNSAFALFVTAWAKAAATGGEVLLHPHFDTHSYFPAEHLSPLDSDHSRGTMAFKRYVFDGQAIRNLRVQMGARWKSLTSTGRMPSRVVAVSAFLTQALLRADRARHGRPRATVIGQLIDIRGRTDPPVPKHAFGTWLSGSFLEFTAEEAAAHAMGKNLPDLAAQIHRTTARGVSECARVLRDKELGRKLLVDNFLEVAKKADSSDWKVIWVTDVSKCGEYDADFGFGKPEWVSLAAMPVQDHMLLFSNRSNDGIEALVCLEKPDMQFFRPNVEEISMLTSNL